MTSPDDMTRTDELQLLRARLLQLQRDKEEMQKDREELHRLLHSRSWKLTAPLRRLTEWGRRLRPARQAKEQTLPSPQGAIVRRALLWQQHIPCESLPGQGQNLQLWTAQQGNAFFHEIAHLLKCGLEDAGIPCTAFTAGSMADCLRQDDGKGAIRLIIAPHEFYHFIPEAAFWPLDGAQLWMLNSEQAHTPWFATALGHLRKADLVLDMDLSMAARLRAQGIPAQHIPLLYSPSCRLFDGAAPIAAVPATESLAGQVRQWPCAASPLEEALSGRPLDCCFFGAASERRSHFFARNAALFAGMAAYLRLESRNTPLLYGKNSSLSTQAVCSIIRRSKVSLNVHQSEHAYFEWHRIVLQGIWHGTVVLSEPCTDAWPFHPDEDYIAASLEDMPAVLDYVLHSAEGIRWAEKIRQHAWETLTGNPLALRWQAITGLYAVRPCPQHGPEAEASRMCSADSHIPATRHHKEGL